MIHAESLVAIEGNSFAGKSTSVKGVEARYGLPSIDEYFHYAERLGQTFPSFPPESLDDARRSIDFFVRIEQQRSADAVALSCQRQQPVVMDRSPFSCIVFQWTVKQNMPSIPEAYAYSLEAFMAEHEKGNIVFPDGLVHLEPESEEIFRRRVHQRGKVDIDFLNDVETLKAMRDWYERTIEIAYPDTGIMLRTVEGDVDMTSRHVYEHISRVAGSDHPADISAFFEVMLDDC